MVRERGRQPREEDDPEGDRGSCTEAARDANPHGLWVRYAFRITSEQPLLFLVRAMPNSIALSALTLSLALFGYAIVRRSRRRDQWRPLRQLGPVSVHWLADRRRSGETAASPYIH